ncbi:Pyrimidine operon regulatory protein PyrR [hydrothermal vent metagenome]|uniref:Pyrimidine operon regulatory protein PyrR n=1 Tax=hydrothermal vent metagenome TaxID=652676 RepID=A0A3B1B4W6_9ZZZZ
MNNSNNFTSADAVGTLIEQMADELKSHLAAQGITQPIMIGIHTGGAWLAEHLHRLLELEDPLGSLDIAFYRDDFTRIGMNPQVRPSNLPTPVDDRHIILIDDVLQTGRTIRAALNEIFDYGRPASVILATLVERSGRELPIEPNVVGICPNLKPENHITLIGPAPLELIISDTKQRSRQGANQ